MTQQPGSVTGNPSPVSSAAMARRCREPGRILHPSDKSGFLVCFIFVWTQSFAIMVCFPGTEHVCCGGQAPWRSKAAGSDEASWCMGCGPCCSQWLLCSGCSHAGPMSPVLLLQRCFKGCRRVSCPSCCSIYFYWVRDFSA